MPDETTPQTEDTSPITDAPAVEGTSAEPTQAETDWAKRYSDLQPEYTRATQEAATLREQNQAWQVLTTSDDPEQRSLAAQILGIELEDEDTQDDEYLDPADELRKEIADLRQWRDTFTQQQQQEQQAIQDAEYIDGALKAIEQDQGYELTDKQTQAIAGLAILNPDDQGRPNVAGAFELFQESSKAEVDRILKGKKRAPQVPGGQPASKQVDLSTRQARENRLLEILEAQQDQAA